MPRLKADERLDQFTATIQDIEMSAMDTERKIKLIRALKTLAVSLVAVEAVVDDDVEFLIGIKFPNQSAIISTVADCPACLIEAVFRAAMNGNIRHEDGSSIFDDTDDANNGDANTDDTNNKSDQITKLEEFNAFKYKSKKRTH